MTDHRDFEAGKQVTTPNGEAGGVWWKRDADKLSGSLFRSVDSIRQRQQFRTQDNLRHARLYGNFDAIGFGPRDHAQRMSSHINRIALNLIAACVDTLTAKIAKSRPRPSFQTSGGDWGLQQKAKKLDKFCQGQFYEADLHSKGQRVFRDACIFGTGALKFGIEYGRVIADRVLIDDIVVDDAEGIHGAPRQLFHRPAGGIAREVLLQLYPEKEQEITAARRVEGAYEAGFGDMVEVIEGWHLRSGPEGKDGKHVIAVSSGVLLEEDWKSDYFPFAFLRLYDRVTGFWGQGLAERLTGIQLEINRILREVAETMRLVSKGRILLENGSKVVKSHLNNDIGTIVTFSGTPPTLWNADAVPKEQLEQLDRLWTRGFEDAGISQLDAAAKKPAGLDAAVALREYSDIGSERFALAGQAYEKLYLDAARIMIDLARGEALRTGKRTPVAGYSVKVPGRKFLSTINWKEINLEDDAYMMQAFPVSSLPSSPAARRQEVLEWINAGWCDKVEGRRLMNLPDLEASTNVAVAALDDVDATIDELLDGKELGEEVPLPDEHSNLDAFVSRGTAALLRARHEGAPSDVLDQLTELVDAAQGLLDQEAAAAAAAQMPPPGLSPVGAAPDGVPAVDPLATPLPI